MVRPLRELSPKSSVVLMSAKLGLVQNRSTILVRGVTVARWELRGRDVTGIVRYLVRRGLLTSKVSPSPYRFDLSW